MSDSTELTKRDNPEKVMREMEAAYSGRRLRVSELFKGPAYESVRQSILATGKYAAKDDGRTLHVQTRPVEGSDDPEIVAIAAVARDPGRTQDAIDLVQDFFPRTATQRARTIQQYWEIYHTEGMINNAVNKYAALLSVGGRCKVRKAKKGKKQNALDELQTALDYWVRYVNGPTATGVATAARGLKALTEQAMRVALIEGDWIARGMWSNQKIPGGATFSLPMSIQTISMEFLEPLPGLRGFGELWYWRPDAELLKLIRGEDKEAPKEVKDIIKRLFDNEITKQLKKEDRALLNPMLLMHVRHRGSDRTAYGESFIEPAKLGIRFSRAVTNADMVSMESVINRLMIVQVGSSDPASPYSKSDVAVARAALMQSFFEDPGPTMTIVWQGDDVKVESFGAMDQILAVESRHEIGERKVKIALGIPDALLSGSTSDGKSAGWASLIAANGMAESLASNFGVVWTIMAERIALENGFTDVEIVFEFDRSNLADQQELMNQARQNYTSGLWSIYDAIAATGKDPWAVYRQRCFERGLEPADVMGESPTWEEVFMPPQGMAGQGTDGAAPGNGGGNVAPKGRKPDGEQTKPKKTTPTEKKTPVENK